MAGTLSQPKSYKRTEVGVIPDDWEIKKFEEISHLDPENLGSGTNPNYFFKYISLEDVDKGILRGYSEQYFGSAPSRARRIVKKGDVLLSTVRPNLKSHLLIKEDVKDTICSTGFSVIRCKPSKAYPPFIFSHLFAGLIERQIEGLLTGSNYPAISSRDVKTLQIPCPPFTEQVSIAAVLSDTDALIESLEKLIAKKRAIKQGAMQELLTGKRRLPGFNGKWEVKNFPSVCWFQEGPGVRNAQFTDSGVKLLNGTNIYRGHLYLDNTDRFISEAEAFGPYSHFLADVGDIVIACSGIAIDKFEEKIAFVEKSHLPLCMNTSTMRFKTREKELIPLFLFYFLMTDNFKSQIGAQATGSAQLNFGPFHVKRAEIILPAVKEQLAIASLLSEMDAEIAKLDRKLIKYNEIKQGMIQMLLTGKIRLLTN